MTPDNDELVELRARVDCRSVLEAAGWELDAHESTRRAAKYRQGAGQIVIVTHEGKGWFDPLNDRRGDVLALAQHVWGGNLGHARKALRPLAGIAPKLLPMRHGDDGVAFEGDALWNKATRLRPGSPGWSYLADKRRLPAESITRALQFEASARGHPWHGMGHAPGRDGAGHRLGNARSQLQGVQQGRDQDAVLAWPSRRRGPACRDGERDRRLEPCQP